MFHPRATTNDGRTVIFGPKNNGIDALGCFASWENSHKALLKEMWIVVKDYDEPERRLMVKRKYEFEEE